MTNLFTKKHSAIRQLFGRVLLFILLSFSASSFAGVPVPSFTALFSPDTIGPGSVTTLTYTIDNSADSNPVTALAFSNTLPTNVDIATPANVFSNCGVDGILSAPDGGDTISFSDGTLGGSSICTIRVDITSSTVGIHTNLTGDLTSSVGNSGTATDDLNIVSTLPGFSKSFAPASLSLGSRSTLTFTIDNSLNGSRVGNLDFTDNLPAGMVIASPSNASTDCVSANAPDTTLTATPGTNAIVLEANGSNLFPGFEVLPIGATCTVTVDVNTTGIGTLINSTELLADFVSSGKATAKLDVTVDELALTKSFTDDPVTPGDTVNLEFTITNSNRNFSATGIAFSDNLEGTLTGLMPSGSLPGTPCGAGSTLNFASGVLSLTGGNLSADGGSCTFNVALDVPPGAVEGAYPNITSSITGTIDGSGVTGAGASETLFVEAVPILAKSFTDGPVASGGTVTLEYTITNPSPTSTATDITFGDELTDPSGNGSSGGFVLPFPVSVTLPPVPDPPCGAGSSLALISFGTDRQGLELTGGNLAALGSCTFSVTIDIPVGFPAGVYTNTTEAITATISAETRTGNPATDTLAIVGAPRLIKSFTDDPVLPGNTVTLEFTLSHDATAPANATNIAFTDDLTATVPALAGLTAGTATNNCGGTFTGTTNLSLTGGGPLAPGASCTITVPVSVPAGALPGNSYTNTTSDVTATVSGISVTGNPGQDDLNITGLVISKEFTDDPVLPGGTATLVFTLDNTASSLDATVITFDDDVDNLIAGMTVDPASVPPTACGGSLALTSADQVLEFTGGSVLAGANCNFSVTLLVPGGAASGLYSNKTTGNSALVSGNPVTLDPAADVLNVFSDPLTLSKSFSDDPANPGGTVTLEFTLTLDATAPGTADTIAFTDDLNAALAGLATGGMASNNCGGSFSAAPSGSGEILSLTGGGPLAPGASCTISVPLSVPAGNIAGNFINNTSGVTGKIGALDITGLPASDTLNVVNPSVTPPPGFSKTFLTTPAVLGDPVTLRFDIDNSSSSASATNLSFVDDLPAGMTLANPTNASTTCLGGGIIIATPGSSTLSYSGGSIAGTLGSPTTCTLQVDVVTSTAGVFNNTSGQLTSSLGNSGTASSTLTVNGPPGFSKSFAPTTINVDETSTLTFTIDNTANPIASNNLTFSDNLPAGMTVATPNNASTSCTGGTLSAVTGSSNISYSGGSVAVGSSCTIAVDITATGTGTNTTSNLTSSNGNSGSANSTLTVNSSASATAPTATGTGNATMEIIGAGSNCNILEYSWVTPESVTSESLPNQSFPHGLFQFRVGPSCTGTTTFQFTLPSALPAGTQFWKFGATLSNPTPHWYQLPATFAGNTMTFSITDGGDGDNDLTVDGEINDPGGPSIYTATAAPIPTLNQAMQILLIVLLALTGFMVLRRYQVNE